MALNSADQLRFFGNDQPRFLIETRYGDGTASSFQVSGAPIVSGATAFGGVPPSAFVPIGGTAWSGTGATFNYPLGIVSFAAPISANSAFQVDYTYGTFSDQEIDFVTGNFGDMYAMRLALIDNLMSNSYKRARWVAQRGGASYDDSETMSNLMLMRSALIAERTTEQGPLGDIISWDEQQQNW
jgi:hypothetical protein